MQATEDVEHPHATSTEPAQVRNLKAIFSVITRTILPRRVSIFTGDRRLVVDVWRGRVRRSDGASADLDALAEDIHLIAIGSTPISCHVEPIDIDPHWPTGVSSFELAVCIAQRSGTASLDEPAHYHFSASGLPLVIRARDQRHEITRAAEVASFLTQWGDRHHQIIGRPVLLIAVFEDSKELAVSTDAGLTFAYTSSAALGQCCARWRSRKSSA